MSASDALSDKAVLTVELTEISLARRFLVRQERERGYLCRCATGPTIPALAGEYAAPRAPLFKRPCELSCRC